MLVRETISPRDKYLRLNKRSTGALDGNAVIISHGRRILVQTRQFPAVVTEVRIKFSSRLIVGHTELEEVDLLFKPTVSNQ